MSDRPFTHQVTLYELLERRPARFDGPDLTDGDHVRLTGQLARVVAFVRDQKWHTLAEISAATGAPEASVSAQLRNARKERFGAFNIERRHVGHGLYEYRLDLEVTP